MLVKEAHMGRAVNCECGELVQASTDDEVIKKVQAHVEAKHPDLVGKLTVSDILAMAEEV
jgi:predicted small metal-binding protein